MRRYGLNSLNEESKKENELSSLRTISSLKERNEKLYQQVYSLKRNVDNLKKINSEIKDEIETLSRHKIHFENAYKNGNNVIIELKETIKKKDIMIANLKVDKNKINNAVVNMEVFLQDLKKCM